MLATGEEAYLLSPLLYDLTGFPETDVFYGTWEVMIAYLKDFQDACKKYGVKLHTHIGKGMMHCWGAMEFVPEAKAVRQEYFSALGRKTQSDRLKRKVSEPGRQARRFSGVIRRTLCQGGDVFDFDGAKKFLTVD